MVGLGGWLAGRQADTQGYIELLLGGGCRWVARERVGEGAVKGRREGGGG